MAEQAGSVPVVLCAGPEFPNSLATAAVPATSFCYAPRLSFQAGSGLYELPNRTIESYDSKELVKIIFKKEVKK